MGTQALPQAASAFTSWPNNTDDGITSKKIKDAPTLLARNKKGEPRVRLLNEMGNETVTAPCAAGR